MLNMSAYEGQQGLLSCYRNIYVRMTVSSVLSVRALSNQTVTYGEKYGLCLGRSKDKNRISIKSMGCVLYSNE